MADVARIAAMLMGSDGLNTWYMFCRSKAFPFAIKDRALSQA